MNLNNFIYILTLNVLSNLARDSDYGHEGILLVINIGFIRLIAS